ncbi:MAG: alpha/beta fold hydrolase [Micromonosporaceae bacterium]
MSAAKTPARLNYERRGEGPPLVLLHGIGHRWQAWEPVLGMLAAEHDVIAVDLPGFGKSPPLSGAQGPAAIAATIAGFSDELGLDRPHVAGNSLGGGIALELAATGHASSATALSPAGFWTRGEYWWGLSVLRILRGTTFLPVPVLAAMMRSAAVRALAFGMVVHRPAHIAPEHLMGDALALRECDSFAPVARAMRGYAFAGTPNVPVTVAWGTRDRILPHRQALRARHRLPAARHVDLPGCGHVPMTDDPGLVASTILATAKEASA